MALYNISRIITLPLYLTIGVGKRNYDHLEIRSFDDSELRSEDCETILVLETEITLELPKEIDTKAHFLDILQKKKTGIEAKHRLRVKEIQGQIDIILANKHLGGA